MAILKSRQDDNNVYSILGCTENGDVRAIITDEEGNLLVSVDSVVLTSPNGTKYQLTVDNAGSLGTTEI